MLQLVMKISKYCNLRCTYCYEYNELGERRRMSLDTIRRVFTNVREHLPRDGESGVEFIWHGGEPLLIPLSYYEAIGRAQGEIFDGIEVANSVQTNLTVLPDRTIEFLESKRFFSTLGVSFDVYGDRRVDIKGRLRTELVLSNMQKLLDRGIPFGSITVLARNTLPHVANIYTFFDSQQIGFRLLPYYLSADDAQIEAHALTPEEIVDTFKALFDQWLGSEHATPVAPLDDYIDWAIAYRIGAPLRFYDRAADENVFLVGIDGDAWGAGEHYEERFRYGNLADESFPALLASPNRRDAIRRTEQRVDQHCRHCVYFGACPGHFVADASTQQQEMLAASGCPVARILDHIVARLDDPSLRDIVVKGNAHEVRSTPALQL